MTKRIANKTFCQFAVHHLTHSASLRENDLQRSLDPLHNVKQRLAYSSSSSSSLSDCPCSSGCSICSCSAPKCDGKVFFCCQTSSGRAFPLNGVRPIPLCNRLFFCHWTHRSPSAHLVVSFSHIQHARISGMRST